MPNLFTLANLLCGTMAIITTLDSPDRLQVAAYFIAAGALFDLLDGMVARLLGVSGELGKQLDSLADMVTFGVAPALMVRELLFLSLFKHHRSMDWSSIEIALTYLPFLLIAFSALRLAKFNIDTRQTSEFIGLPTPANALFWISIPFIIGPHYISSEPSLIGGLLMNHWVLGLLCVLMSLLLTSEIRLFSMKASSLSLKGNEWRLGLLLSALALIVFLGFAALPLIVLLYILLSLIKNTTDREV